MVITLLAISLLAALGLGLTLSSSTARLADHNHEEAVALLNAAESALELTARDLAAIADWNRVLDGTARSTTIDGPGAGTRTLPGGGSLDLTRLTNELTCGRATTCLDAERQTSSIDRPWGADNPRWRPFLHAPLLTLATRRHPTAPYAIVWMGDDSRETDGDPGVDGGGTAREGRFVLRARAEAFGSDGGRRAIEAELTRVCHVIDSGEVCLPGIRVQSWFVATAAP